VYPFVAVILVCLNSAMPWACNDKTAVDMISNGVESELNWILGWQDFIAGSALAREVGKTAYVKTLCRRTASAADPSARLR
jgi:hypothetical protein